MLCASCRAVLPDAARFCASCGCPAGSDALTMGASQATELSPGGFTQRTPPAAGKPPSSGWLTSSDSISHGRFGPGALLDGRYRIIGLLGRGGMGEVCRAVPYAMRNVLFNFFLLFLLRVVLRRQWPAAAAFAGLFALLGALDNDGPAWVSAAVAFVYFGSGAVVVLRWGLLAYAVGIFVSELLLKLPATLDSSAWYFGNMLTILAVAVALASWGFYSVLPRSASPLRSP